MDDGTDECDSDVQLSEPESDREVQQVVGREATAAPTPFCIPRLRDNHAFLAQVGEAVLRLVEESELPA